MLKQGFVRERIGKQTWKGMGLIFGFHKSNIKPIKAFWGLYKIMGDR
jgi:hypothetical protein